MDRRERFVLVILASLALLVLTGHALLAATNDLLLLGPLFVLLVPLLVGRYPGERAIARLVSRRPTARRTLPATKTAPRRRRPVFARGGLLLACGLAVRPPPVVSGLA